VGTAAASQTTFSYDDVNRIVTTTSDLSTYNDNGLVSKVLYDTLGRTGETRGYEGGTNYVSTQTQYDALGRASKTSNPSRPWQSESAVWTTARFDALGRVISVTTPDSAAVSTAYSGNTVTATDQAGKKRKSVTDGLGRLKEVYEDPTGPLNYLTGYSYDVLDNLTIVSQEAQTRTFVYDSLSRLTSATNPESGMVTYGYDNNGNLTSKLDALSITTTFVYDVLNRVTSKSYNDSPQTPPVSYFYDAQSLPSGAPSFDRGSATGRLVAVTYGSGSSAGTYRGYDALGQVVRQYQRTDSVNYLVEATYNRASGMASETYPSVPGAGDRRTVTYTPDAAGRLASLSSSATTYAPAASVSSIAYAAHNGLSSETYGSSLVHAVTYNTRLQPNEIKLGTSGAPTSIVSITYSYGTTANNGNVLSTSYAGGGLSYTQTFGYDELNRLSTSQEGASWSQSNSYDRYGNRSIVGGGLSFTASNNRITGGSYDAAGNLLNDGAHAYTYDAENKISKVDNVAAYVYDGEGQRVRKLVNENLRFMYDMGGQQIAEFDGATGALKKEYIYSASGLVATIEPTAVNSNGTRYTTSDHLGSPRVVTNSSAGVASRHDFMPFGEELYNGGRTVGMGYGAADGLRQKFTSKERDNETGLDFFEARYYASVHGRFTSPDAPFADQSAEDPQSWNLYSYVRNNPLVMVDPTGRFGDYYNRNGSWAYTDGINDNRVYVLSETQEADGSTNLSPQLLPITHTEFIRSANIVRHEGATDDADEYLWIAHTSNNEANATNTTLSNLLQTGFSSAPASVKNTGVATTDISVRANAARAGILDAVAGGADPTGGARRWDGTDFLAWGLNGPWGNHAKFREFASIHISGQIFSTYENAQIARWGNSVTYSGTRYTIPAAVFTNAANWTQNRDFHYVTGARNQTRNLVATGARGQSVFWRF